MKCLAKSHPQKWVWIWLLDRYVYVSTQYSYTLYWYDLHWYIFVLVLECSGGFLHEVREGHSGGMIPCMHFSDDQKCHSFWLDVDQQVLCCDDRCATKLADNPLARFKSHKDTNLHACSRSCIFSDISVLATVRLLTLRCMILESQTITYIC